MNVRQARIAIFATASAIIIAKAAIDVHKVRVEEQAKRDTIVDELVVETAAIHRATDIINERISRGEIRSYNQLREQVLNEVAFQKIAIQEQL